MSFVHLHVHSQYSLLDGLSKIPDLIGRAQELEMPAVALTDHGTMFGAVEFYREAKTQGIKPIIGMEAYLSKRTMQDRDPQLDSRSYHLLLLAENDEGYRNLLQIASAAQLDGFYYRPRIDREFLAAHSQGLICTTGCLSGEVPRALLRGDDKSARSRLDWYYEVFGADRFFFELQSHGIEELDGVNRQLLDLASRYQGRFVATNDVHYVRPEDAALQDIMLCIQTGTVRSDPDRMRMADETFYLRPADEMANLFGEVPGALENTLLIAERCQVDLDFKGYHLPHFEVPEGHTAAGYLKQLCETGLRRRYGSDADSPEIRQRLEEELDIIHTMGFDTYFLIVWDLVRYAQDHQIWYNARGSAAGSIVAYCLEITMVDPLEHGLIFERFLNPSRVSMPDIDLDFQDDRRHEVLEYTAGKYGEDRVAQIITFGTLGARAAIRDVGRVLDIPLPDVDRVAKLVPNIPGRPFHIEQALDEVSSFREAYESAEYIKELIDTAARLEGTVRNAGTHAAGVIIGDRPIIEYIPLHRPTKGAGEDTPISAVTQFEMQILESLGLLKVDFLGLSTLTVMARASALIQQRHGVELDMQSIPIDDPETYELLSRGDVLGVFQVEGAGMRRYLVEMRPQALANVIAMVALYRPGPMDFIPTYIKRMHDEERVEHRHPTLAPIFEETYGIPVYQEQLMFAAMQLGGYSAVEADKLRKAISKKNAKELRRHRKMFIEGAVENGLDKATATQIFSDWENFARYGFNKAHAADYGTIAVQTAYLKAHYPVEYMTALMSVFRGDSDKVALYIADCRRMGIDVLPPDVNASGIDFEIEHREQAGPAIRYGLAAIKNVGEGAVRCILQAREAHGPFSDLRRFATRVDLRQVGKRALESLIRVGALDGLGERAALLDFMDQVLSYSTGHFRAKDIGQMSMFGASTGVREPLTVPPANFDVNRRQQLRWEKELLGLYVSDHPLTPLMEELTQVISHFSGELDEGLDGQQACVAGVVTHIRRHQTRAGKPMGFVTIEDVQGALELVLFSRIWSQVHEQLKLDQVVVVRGRVDAARGDAKILADEIEIQAYLDLNQREAGIQPGADLEKASAEPEDAPDAPKNSAAPAADRTHPVEPLSPAGMNGGEAKPSEIDDALQNPPASAAEHETEAPPIQPTTVNKPTTVFGANGHRVTINIHASGDKARDTLRMRRVHGLLTSYPGRDRFKFHVVEGTRKYMLEFPNSTTGFCAELQRAIEELLGENTVDCEPHLMES